MKKILCALSFALSAAAANAGPLDFYVGGVGGVGNGVMITPRHSAIDHAAHPAHSFGAVAGIDIPVFRVEAEYNYMTTDAVNLHAAMINGYVKFLPTPIVKPYVGLGIGKVVAGELDGGDKVKKSGAGQGMLGLQFGVPTLPLFIDLEGRIFGANKIWATTVPLSSDEKSVGFLQYDIRAKLRYIF